MSFKTLLVLLDQSQDSSGRLDVACRLTEAHGAHLSALAMSQQISTYVGADYYAGAAVIDVEQMEALRKEAQAVAADAKKHIGAHGILGDVRWVSHEEFGLREAAAVQGRHADLVIAGQPAGDRNIALREAVLEGAMFSSGRPVLVVPVKWDKPVEARHIMVAWDGSKEAARALSDAAPLLDKAGKITIVVVDPRPGYDGTGADPGADIAVVLARHCDDVEVDKIPSSGTTIADALLTRTIDAAGDLVVMGGYGHSPLRESIFGGVTRQMLRQTSVPLLISH